MVSGQEWGVDVDDEHPWSLQKRGDKRGIVRKVVDKKDSVVVWEPVVGEVIEERMVVLVLDGGRLDVVKTKV